MTRELCFERDSRSRFFDKVFLTNIPAFYKIRLYNEIAKRAKILVVFLREGNPDRNKDFYAEPRNFEWRTLPAGTQKQQARECVKLLRTLDYKELVIGGWDELSFWAAAFCSPRAKNAVVVESSYLESATSGPKAWVKRIFLSRISKAYCSGASNIKLVEMLGFRGNIKKTGGVGLYRRVPQPPFEPRERIKNFLYVGRLSPEKNPEFLVRAFAKLPELTLNVVGFGPQEEYLKSLAGMNVVFHGAVANAELPKFYQANDVFVLPSKSEVWGMVVEEALNNGVPVLVSDSVGCAEELIVGKNVGLIFKTDDEQDFIKNVERMRELKFYNDLRKTISQNAPEAIEIAQVKAYGGGVIRAICAKEKTIVKTGGVGLYRRVPQPPFEPRERVKNFLYVGRLSPEKNLEFLIRAFSKLPELTLNIVGFGPQEEYLKSLAGTNVVFHGAVANAELPKFYQANDVFVLPSKSEPWGMVVEEALNNGVPVLVSDRVGCAEEVVRDGENGLVFEACSETSFLLAVSRLANPEFYNHLRECIAKSDFEEVECAQIFSYL